MVQKAFNPSGRLNKIPTSVWNDLAGFSTISNERIKVNGKCVRWQKPESIIRRMILASTKENDVVLDPFGGVATVPVVCKKLNRQCYSTEIDKAIFCAGRQRLRSV
jgi:DNA modification methylase